ncbi:hypothetical protein [Neorhizobium alkalisoli]|uniref:Uncharacterized protein n=1 Tax=Neorhizobium alkalisoli TaxID=528178 RepID=A0A561QUS6_9HYPH|nr:hypothetical protein [Neorhizobium alkalisoli]TWF54143.1 hypothetical protein FHW37_1032 [Neorhizobium alkalisoli]
MTSKRITLRHIWQYTTFPDKFTVLVLIAVPFWMCFDLFLDGQAVNKLARVIGPVCIIGMVIILWCYLLILYRQVRRAVAEEAE